MLKLYTGLQTWWADLKARATEEHGATAGRVRIDGRSDRSGDHPGGDLHRHVCFHEVQRGWIGSQQRRFVAPNRSSGHRPLSPLSPSGARAARAVETTGIPIGTAHSTQQNHSPERNR